MLILASLCPDFFLTFLVFCPQFGKKETVPKIDNHAHNVMCRVVTNEQVKILTNYKEKYAT